jgi:GTPase involved in cell partitioning and DNA repair
MQAGDGYMIVFSLSWIHSIESLEENHMGEILHARKIKMERHQFDKDIELPPMVRRQEKKQQRFHESSSNAAAILIQSNRIVSPSMQILVGAKKDLASERVVPQSEIDALCAKYRMKYFETSALTGEGVREAFEGLMRCIKERNPPADKKSKLQAASAKKDAKSGSRANCAIQ